MKSWVVWQDKKNGKYIAVASVCRKVGGFIAKKEFDEMPLYDDFKGLTKWEHISGEELYIIMNNATPIKAYR